ncbi:kinase-like domain-containing protein [Penicillium canescens]|uniref:kinase-like domain-containing protein n=1 Tax=Penicillium canescens TaxID=5083 RepID=UPI0026DF1E94|nr:kinase-like domain-containing protein [Penicillium canescens]KAJ6047187.1 kinase-like domain-containing protein [Penicillium canescens]KAJ6174385.1 kinase-like domain-containing protein [Penicillium canescens]
MFRLCGLLSKCHYFRRPVSPVRQFAQSNVQLLDSNVKLEEETLPWYTQDRSYPVKIGEVFQARYQVLGKLGFGGYSTVWLCRDLTHHKYVTLKVFERDSAEGKREVEAYYRIHASKASHDGAKFVRKALDSFQIGHAEGIYQCLVHQPLGMSLYDLRTQFTAKILPEKLLKMTLVHILLALDYLHAEAGIIHTDIQEKNIMLGIEDISVLVDFEEAEKSSPSPRKIAGDRLIYASRKLKKTKQHGQPILCDFGQARFGSIRYCGDIQPYIYRAPEVLLHMSWDHKVDIWNIGLVAWDLSQTKHLFYARDSKKQNSDANHIAEMVALLGPPPREMINGSGYAKDFFDLEGTLPEYKLTLSRH